MEQTAQREMMELYKRRDKDLQEKEDKLRKLERDLNEKERMLEAQEKMKTPYEEMLKEIDRQIELKMAEMRRRQKLIEEREANLNTPKIVDRTMKGIAEERKEEKTQDMLEFERECIQGAIGNQGNTEGVECRKSVSTNTVKLNENQNKDRSLLFPKFSPFSGEDPKPKLEASYEEWKYEVNCKRRGGIYSDEIIAQAIRKSARGQAKSVLLTMGITARVESILKRLEGVFGNLATGESILQEFYTAFQKPEESVNSWDLRLEKILQKAID